MLKPNKFKVSLANILPDLALGLLKLIIIQIDPGEGLDLCILRQNLSRCAPFRLLQAPVMYQSEKYLLV